MGLSRFPWSEALLASLASPTGSRRTQLQAETELFLFPVAPSWETELQICLQMTGLAAIVVVGASMGECQSALWDQSHDTYECESALKARYQIGSCVKCHSHHHHDILFIHVSGRILPPETISDSLWSLEANQISGVVPPQLGSLIDLEGYCPPII